MLANAFLWSILSLLYWTDISLLSKVLKKALTDADMIGVELELLLSIVNEARPETKPAFSVMKKDFGTLK